MSGTSSDWAFVMPTHDVGHLMFSAVCHSPGTRRGTGVTSLYRRGGKEMKEISPLQPTGSLLPPEITMSCGGFGIKIQVTLSEGFAKQLADRS